MIPFVSLYYFKETNGMTLITVFAQQFNCRANKSLLIQWSNRDDFA